jgi:membrane protein YqaA with SNARE-associated domain
MKNRINNFVHFVRQKVDRWWYSPVLGFLAFIDLFVVVIPTDGLIITSSMAVPKKIYSLALWTTIGSTLGSVAYAYFFSVYGWDLVHIFINDIESTQVWIHTESFFHQYGGFLLFLVALSPLAQQPAIILAALSHTPLMTIFLLVLLGRLMKYLFLAYISTHAPRLLAKLWGIQSEIEEVEREDVPKY